MSNKMTSMQVRADRNEAELRLLSICTNSQQLLTPPNSMHCKSIDGLYVKEEMKTFEDSSPFEPKIDDEYDRPRRVRSYIFTHSTP